jgi:hypothetical protein
LMKVKRRLSSSIPVPLAMRMVIVLRGPDLRDIERSDPAAAIDRRAIGLHAATNARDVAAGECNGSEKRVRAPQ